MIEIHSLFLSQNDYTFHHIAQSGEIETTCMFVVDCTRNQMLICSDFGRSDKAPQAPNYLCLGGTRHSPNHVSLQENTQGILCFLQREGVVKNKV
jgi:hypothetical protein